MILNLISTLLAVNSLGIEPKHNFNYYNEQSSISYNCKMTALSIGLENPLDDQHVIRDLSGNIFVVQEDAYQGFMVYDPVSGKHIEGVMKANCPFAFDDFKENYYFGPMNYYYRIGESFVHYIDDKYNIDLSEAYRLQKSFDTFLENLRKEPSHQISQKLSKGNNVSLPNDFYTYVDNYQYVKDCVYPRNYDNTCGFVAASVILHYWDKTVHDGVVDAAFKDPVMGDLNSTDYYSPSTNIKDKLVNYSGTNASTGRIVSEAVNDYCEDYGIQGSASWSLFGFGIADSLRNNRPVVIFGYLPHVQNGGMLMHAVVCYGYHNYGYGIDYVVNYCWTNYDEVILNDPIIGETMYFSLNDNYYKESYTITPSDYGFSSSYTPVELDQNVSLGSLNFSTKRLRCGYIENQYINLSPRKQGFGTAYLDFKFINPIRSLTINISFWSNKEMYNSTACAYIKSKPLTDTDQDAWVEDIDLLHDVVLSKDRNNQTVINLSFPKKTREIRVYAHFNDMPPPTDRNKGRISIGNITIDSYN